MQTARLTRPALASAAALIALALIAAPALGASPPRKGARYVGYTDQALGFGSVELRVSRTGRSIRWIDIPVSAECSNGRDYEFWFRLRAVPVTRAGEFRTSRGVVGEGVTDGDVSFRGRFRNRGREMTASFRERYRTEDGRSCDTGRIAMFASIRR